MNIFNLKKMSQNENQQFLPDNVQWQQAPGFQNNNQQQNIIPQQNALKDVTQDDIQQDTPQQQNINATQPIQNIQKKYPQFNSVFQAYRWAKQNNQAMRIEYTTLSNRHIIRDIEPHGDFFPKTTNRRNFITWDQTVGGIRGYIMQNINKYEFLGKKFSPKFNFSRTRRNFKRRINNRTKKRHEQTLMDKRQKMNKISEQLKNIKKTLIASNLEVYAKQVQDIQVKYSLTQGQGIVGYWIKNQRCLSNCYRSKRNSNKNLSSQQITFKCLQQYNNNIDKPGDKFNKFAQKQEVLDEIDVKYNFTQGQGILGYSIKNSRCLSNCFRQKRNSDKNKSAQQITFKCLQQYNKNINKPGDKFNKYAQSNHQLSILNSQDTLKLAMKLYQNGNTQISKQITKIASQMIKQSGIFQSVKDSVSDTASMLSKGKIGGRGDQFQVIVEQVNTQMKYINQVILAMQTNFLNKKIKNHYTLMPLSGNLQRLANQLGQIMVNITNQWNANKGIAGSQNIKYIIDWFTGIRVPLLKIHTDTNMICNFMEANKLKLKDPATKSAIQSKNLQIKQQIDRFQTQYAKFASIYNKTGQQAPQQQQQQNPKPTSNRSSEKKSQQIINHVRQMMIPYGNNVPAHIPQLNLFLNGTGWQVEMIKTAKSSNIEKTAQFQPRNVSNLIQMATDDTGNVDQKVVDGVLKFIQSMYSRYGVTFVHGTMNQDTQAQTNQFKFAKELDKLKNMLQAVNLNPRESGSENSLVLSYNAQKTGLFRFIVQVQESGIVLMKILHQPTLSHGHKVGQQVSMGNIKNLNKVYELIVTDVSGVIGIDLTGAVPAPGGANTHQPQFDSLIQDLHTALASNPGFGISMPQLKKSSVGNSIMYEGIVGVAITTPAPATDNRQVLISLNNNGQIVVKVVKMVNSKKTSKPKIVATCPLKSQQQTMQDIIAQIKK